MRAGVQGEGRWAVDGVARLVFVGDQGGRSGRRGSGGRAGDQAVGRGCDGGVEGFAGRGRAIGARERDIDGGVGFFSRPGSARHGVDGRLRRRVQGPFRGRASRRGAGRPAGLRVRHAMRLTGPDPDTRQPHGRRARGAGPRHPRGPCRFLHGRVRVPQDARPVVGAGPGSGRDRPRLGDGHHAGTGSPRRAPRRDVRHRQTGEGARAAGPASWDAGSRRGARTGCTWPASPACAWPTDASAARRPAADVLARGCM